MKLTHIKSRKDFLKIRNNFIEKFFNKNFLLMCGNNNFNYPRIGITISKKIDKRAVVRNHQKRRIREVMNYIFKNNRQLLVDGFDYEIIGRRELLEENYNELKNKIIDILTKIEEKYGRKNS